MDKREETRHSKGQEEPILGKLSLKTLMGAQAWSLQRTERHPLRKAQDQEVGGRVKPGLWEICAPLF